MAAAGSEARRARPPPRGRHAAFPAPSSGHVARRGWNGGERHVARPLAAVAEDGGRSSDVGDFQRINRDDEGRALNAKGKVIGAPENTWVADMAKEWEATGYDERFFDDDWDDVNPNKNDDRPRAEGGRGEKAEKSGGTPEYPFADLEESEWLERDFSWEAEAAEEEGVSLDGASPAARAAAAAAAEAIAAGGPQVSASSAGSTRAEWSAPVQDLTEAEEAAQMGFSDGLDAEEEPEGPPAVLLAGFRAEEVPRVRELLDELGGHEVPVIPVPQAHLTQPLVAALSLREPDWENPRQHGRFNQGGEFGSQRAVIFSGLDRGEMATIVSAIEARGLPRLLTVVITSENCEQTLGEALARSVKAARAEKSVRDEYRKRDIAAELAKLERAAKTSGMTMQEMVQWELARQDQLAADEAAALAARNERADRAETHMAELKEKYLASAREKAVADAVGGKARATDEDDENAAGFPTLEDTVSDALGEDGMEVDLSGLEGVSEEDVAAAVQAAVDEAMRRSEGAASPAAMVDAAEAEAAADGRTTKAGWGSGPGGENVESLSRENAVDDGFGGMTGTEAEPQQRRRDGAVEAPAATAVTCNDDEFDDGCYEVDPTRWSRRVEADTAVFNKPPAPVPPTSAVPIDEPASADPYPAGSTRRNIKDAASAGPPADRRRAAAADEPRREVVEAQVMTKRMLRELAMRRGVSYSDMIAQAEASGIELPDE